MTRAKTPARRRGPADLTFVEPVKDAAPTARKAAKKAAPKAPRTAPVKTTKRAVRKPAQHKHAQPVETIEVTPAGLDPDRLMFADIDTTVLPTFSVKEVAKTFYGMTDHWLRMREKNLTYNGEPIEVRRSESSFRVYDLGTIERLTHALVQNHRISGQTAVHALTALNAIGKIHGYLPSDD